MIRPEIGTVITVTLITNEAIIATVARNFADGGFTLDKVKIIVALPDGAIVLDRFQPFSATESYTFPPHAILTVNKPVAELEKFYSLVDQEDAPKMISIDTTSESLH